MKTILALSTTLFLFSGCFRSNLNKYGPIIIEEIRYYDEDAVLIVVQIPVNVNEDSENIKTTKFVSNRVMKMIFLAEKCLVKLDVCSTKQEQEDKFVYLKMIKKVGESL